MNKNICDTCKTRCLDKLQYVKENIIITKCDFFSDKEPPEFEYKCSKCGLPRLTHTVSGNKLIEHDSCLPPLPGVISACCGHGKHDGHIIFSNGTRIGFKNPEIIRDWREIKETEEL